MGAPELERKVRMGVERDKSESRGGGGARGGGHHER